MKLNKLLVVVGLIALYTHTQAQQPKWGIHNSIVDYANLTTSPLPTSPNPDYTQNAVWDANGNIVIYQADGIIYNSNGGVVLDLENEGMSLYSNNSLFLKGFTEFIFVPVQGECDLFYGITTYTNGAVFNTSNYVSDIVWCKIDVSGGQGVAVVLPQTGMKIAKEDIICENKSHEGAQGPNPLDFQMHIEISTKQSNGNRYLFASNNTCVSVLEVTSTGISFIAGYLGGVFIPNLRSEMEVFQVDNNFEVAMHYYNDGTQSTPNNLSVFTFDMNGSSPIISHYTVEIPGLENTYRYIKGLEFSEDGLTLYASVLTINSTITSIVSGNNVIYFSRPNLNSQFLYGGVITNGNSTMGFGLGMIEKGGDGKLWIVRDSTLATLADFNDPLSLFNANAMSISNQLTQATHFENYNGYPTVSDVLYRKMYLLVDQVDKEDYTTWTSGLDLYPPIIYVCSFPVNLNVPANSVISYLPPPIMTGGSVVSVLHPGTMSIQYVYGEGCTNTEIINFVQDEYCDANFTYYADYEKYPNKVDVTPSQCAYGGQSIQHKYELFEKDSQGNWIFITSCISASCTLSPINLGNQYKITHTVTNVNSICFPVLITDVIFNY